NDRLGKGPPGQHQPHRADVLRRPGEEVIPDTQAGDTERFWMLWRASYSYRMSFRAFSGGSSRGQARAAKKVCIWATYGSAVRWTEAPRSRAARLAARLSVRRTSSA